MSTLAIQNTVVVKFSNGSEEIHKRNKSVMEIQEEFYIAKGFYPNNSKIQIKIESVTVYKN